MTPLRSPRARPAVAALTSGALAFAALAFAAVALPAVHAAPACSELAPNLQFCDYQGGTYKETSLVLDQPGLARAGVREVWFYGFVGPETNYEAFAGTSPDSPVGENGASVGYRCLQLNGGPSCNLLVAGAAVSLAGLGGPAQFAGYSRDFANPGGWCLQGDLANQCVPANWPLPPLPAL